ncbi:hypothetical protein [Saccharothrix hoggarensis]|uniref:Uncharacterized protein n=1 Tax=Saccharothrix hoggarensis TaxID=913853 RepID=A0ABW3QFY2_9PSEU
MTADQLPERPDITAALAADVATALEGADVDAAQLPPPADYMERVFTWMNRAAALYESLVVALMCSPVDLERVAAAVARSPHAELIRVRATDMVKPGCVLVATPCAWLSTADPGPWPEPASSTP